ncbi:MAG: beta galactosidase jelly roll domain-containing protein [Gammaproteobacteria bacterium]|nr:beta galactosidase jelly roll domain-containing protein [Gammaproteobacteria bacterium]
MLCSRLVATLLCLALLSGCASINAHRNAPSGSASRSGLEQLSLDGTWRFSPGSLQASNAYEVDYDDRNWVGISVPANWYSQGHDMAGVAWYRRTFELPEAMRGKRIRLNFEGVDYATDVWINGKHVGFHEGYFQPFAFDISKSLNQHGANLIAIRVDSPNEDPSGAWSLRKRLIKGIFSHHDTRPGGAWSPRGQERNTGGIWAPVTLVASSDAAVEALQVVPQVQPDGGAFATLKVRVSLPLDATAMTGEVSVRVRPENFTADSHALVTRSVLLKPGTNDYELVVRPNRPQLWWPAELGEPNLYRADVEIRAGTRTLDTASDVFGLRKVTRNRETGEWHVNGKRFFLRGTNYIATQWLGEMTTASYERDLQLMRAAHINAVRVHAHVAGRQFYEVCDRIGMLVWQDFPLQWGYVDDEAFVQEASRQASDMVREFFNHPSIITWSMHNEPPWDASWMKYKYPDYEPGQNKRLDEALFAVVSREEPSRYVHSHSATSEHPWFGWYSGTWKDHGKPTSQNLITEFGAQALPDVASLKKIFAPEHLWPTTDESWAQWDYHNFQRRETFEIAKVPMGDSLSAFVRNTQQYQAKLIQFAIESYRRQRYQPVGAIFQFMFVEDWPSVNWGALDYWRNPKPGYRAMQRGYQPVLPSIEWSRDKFATGEPVEFAIWVLNDLHKTFPNAELRVRVLRDESAFEAVSFPVNIPPDSGRLVHRWQSNSLVNGNYELVAEIVNGSEQVLGRNSFAFEVANSYAAH